MSGHNYIFFGIQASGKGTQAKLLADKLGIAHISTGDILRAEMKAESAEGQKVQEYVDSGKLVPDEILLPIFAKRFAQEDCQNGFILDGFPRTLNQGKQLDEVLAEQDRSITRVLHIKLDQDELIRRLNSRWICRECGSIYNINSAPPAREGICDKCQGELYQRDDDTNLASIQQRIASYHDQTGEVIKYFQDQGIVTDIDGNPDIEAVHAAILDVIGF